MGRILELARSRRSIRSYSCDPVPLEDVAYIVDVARHAPSGANKQPWRFLVIRDPLVKKLIRGKCEEVERRFHERVDPEFREWLRSRGISWRKPFLTDAPILILVFARRGEPYWIESTWISIGYLILAAEELGYSTLTYTPSEVDWSNKILQVPEEYVLQAIIPIGKPAERREAREQDRRLSLHEVCYLDSWGKGLEI
ncbi:MAG: nitroreductase family protein [Thaumarchaeota archaeon]|nr:nitroreductase family protein [Nitrososphaerota archaeon]